MFVDFTWVLVSQHRFLSLADTYRLPQLDPFPRGRFTVIVLFDPNVLKLLEKTCSVHEVSYVAGGLRVRHDLVVIHPIDPNIQQLFSQTCPRYSILRTLHNNMLRHSRPLVTTAPVCLLPWFSTGSVEFQSALYEFKPKLHIVVSTTLHMSGGSSCLMPANYCHEAL